MTTAVRRAAELAHVLFVREGWTWRDEEVPPSVEEIEAAFLSLADMGKGSVTAASGRLKVERNDSDGVDYFLTLGMTAYGEEYPA